MLTSGQASLGYPTLGEIITASKNKDVLGISDRASIIDYIQRAIEIATWKANWNPYLGEMDICSDECGLVSLPAEVGTVLACNVGGFPAQFRNDWYQYHVNGPGSSMGVPATAAAGVAGMNLGGQIGWSWQPSFSPVIQQLKEWCYVVAIVEDPIDGDGSLTMQVFGETMDAGYNDKSVITIPAVGASQLGIRIPMLAGYAATDPNATQMKRIHRVIKPITRGYVKLIAFPGQQQAQGVTLGYYGPNETAPLYRQIKVGVPCKWVRIKYRRSEIRLVDDTDIIPLPSKYALINLLKSVRYSDTGNVAQAAAYAAIAVEILQEREAIEAGPGFFKIQVEPGFGMGSVDYR